MNIFANRVRAGAFILRMYYIFLKIFIVCVYTPSVHTRFLTGSWVVSSCKRRETTCALHTFIHPETLLGIFILLQLFITLSDTTNER